MYNTPKEVRMVTSACYDGRNSVNFYSDGSLKYRKRGQTQNEAQNLDLKNLPEELNQKRERIETLQKNVADALLELEKGNERSYMRILYRL